VKNYVLPKNIIENGLFEAIQWSNANVYIRIITLHPELFDSENVFFTQIGNKLCNLLFFKTIELFNIDLTYNNYSFLLQASEEGKIAIVSHIIKEYDIPSEILLKSIENSIIGHKNNTAKTLINHYSIKNTNIKKDHLLALSFKEYNAPIFSFMTKKFNLDISLNDSYYFNAIIKHRILNNLRGHQILSLMKLFSFISQQDKVLKGLTSQPIEYYSNSLFAHDIKQLYISKKLEVF